MTLFITVTGCNSKTYEKRQYVLDVTRRYPPSQTKIADTIVINRFTINPVFSDKPFIYKLSEFEYESDYYNEFYIPPSVMITEKVRNWFTESDLFQRVFESSSYGVTPDYILEGNINSLYWDLRDTKLPIAVMEIRFFLSKNHFTEEPDLIFSKNYKYSFIFENGIYVDLIKASDSCLFEILTKVEKDLKEILLTKSPDMPKEEIADY